MGLHDRIKGGEPGNGGGRPTTSSRRLRSRDRRSPRSRRRPHEPTRTAS